MSVDSILAALAALAVFAVLLAALWLMTLSRGSTTLPAAVWASRAR